MLISVLAAGCRGKSSSESVSSKSRSESAETNGPNPSHSSPETKVRFQTRESKTLDSCAFQNGREAEQFTILEIVGGGVSCIDFDSDGNIDLFFAGGGSIDPKSNNVLGRTSRLLRGADHWKLEDCTAKSGLHSKDYVHGMTSSDFDQDGFPDAILYGYHGVRLFRNLGDGTFQDCTESAGLKHSEWTTAVAWLDGDSDANLDLYLAGYVGWNFDTHRICPTPGNQPDVCSPTVFAGVQNVTVMNRDAGIFEKAQLFKAPSPAKSLGLLCAEFESGQGTSLYVANDLVPNFLFAPAESGHEESAILSGAAVDDQGVANGSMGLALFDFNNDQRFDVFVTNFEHEQMGLYLNQGSYLFEHASRRAGLNAPDAKGVGFGVVAGDFDGDGDEDIVFNNGHVHYHPDNGSMHQQPIFLENQDGKRLVRQHRQEDFFRTATVGRGLATADMDRDGDLDLVATSLFGPPEMVENRTSNTSHWLSLRLIGTVSPRTPIGATVQMRVGKHVMSRQLYGGGSYLSQSEQRLHFSWPEDSETASFSVLWPSGAKQEFEVAPNQHITIIEMRDSAVAERVNAKASGAHTSNDPAAAGVKQ